jgi:hypothetical protein
MFFAILTIATALAISAIAIYYSVAGLAAIFAAAVIPIVIMGSVLEVAKLVTAVWLHRYWHRCVWWLKTYLSLAVVVLMFITSMGIFGFLSRAHIEQTSLSVEQAAQSVEITDQLERLEGRVARWNEELDRLFSGSDVRVDSLLSREQEELNAIYARVEREKSQLRQDAQSSIEIQNNRLQQAQDRRDQTIAAARLQFSDNPEALSQAIQQASAAEVSVASAAQREIVAINRTLSEQLDAVDSRVETQIADVQNRINQLRTQSTSRTDEIDQRITQLENQIRDEQAIIADLRQQRSAAEREFRMLEAEVGPIKYIAEFVYGETADKELLEAAVRWVIIIIIFVFDPLAVLLLIAGQYTLNFCKEEKENGGIGDDQNKRTTADSDIDNPNNASTEAETVDEGRSADGGTDTGNRESQREQDVEYTDPIQQGGEDSTSEYHEPQPESSSIDDMVLAVAESFAAEEPTEQSNTEPTANVKKKNQ